MFAVTTDELSLIMFIFGCLSGAVILLATQQARPRKESELSKRTHPTSLVSPQSLHRKQQDIILEASRMIEELAEQASWNEWKWSYKYYLELSETLMRHTTYHYFVDADKRKQALPE